jgi:RHS repeat-associated protein
MTHEVPRSSRSQTQTAYPVATLSTSARRVGFAVLACTLTAVSGCGERAPKPVQPTERVSGALTQTLTVTVKKGGVAVPQAGIVVKAYSGSTQMATGLTDSFGDAQLTVDSPGTYQFRAWWLNREFTSDPIFSCTLPACTGGAVDVQDVTVRVQRRNITGPPTDVPDGQLVKAMGDAGQLSSGTTTQGTVVLPVPPSGTFRLLTYHFNREFWSDPLPPCASPQCPEEILKVGDVTVSVVRTQTDGSVGNVAENVVVKALSAADGTWISQGTTSGGTVTLPVPDGQAVRFQTYWYGREYWNLSTPACSFPNCPAEASTIMVADVTVTVHRVMPGQTTQPVPDGTVVKAWRDGNWVSQGNTSGGTVKLPVDPAGNTRFLTYWSGQEFWSGDTDHCGFHACQSVRIDVGITVNVMRGGQPVPDGTLVKQWSGSTWIGNAYTVGGKVLMAGLTEGSSRFLTYWLNKDYWSGETDHCAFPNCRNVQINVGDLTVAVRRDGESVPDGTVVKAFAGPTAIATGYTASGNVTLPVPAQGSVQFLTYWYGREYWSESFSHCGLSECLIVPLNVADVRVTVRANGHAVPDGTWVKAFSNSTWISQGQTAGGVVTLPILPQSDPPLRYHRFLTYWYGRESWSGTTDHCGYPECKTWEMHVAVEPADGLEPLVTCVVPQSEGYTAVFGYRNTRGVNVYLPPSATNNFLTPGPVNQGQPGWFQAGTAAEPAQLGAFRMNFPSGGSVTWRIGSLTAIASPASPICTEGSSPSPYGDLVYLSDNTPVRMLPDPDRVVANAIGGVSGTGTARGNTSGALNVSADGAATYSLPLFTPEGAAGHKPQLSLDYSSRGGNGVMGVGWRLGGVSSIEVCHFNVSQGDLQTLPLDFAHGKYALCLDGRRIKNDLYREPLDPPAQSASLYYIEGDIRSRVIRQDIDALGPRTIVVKDGNGNTAEYGNTYIVEGNAHYIHSSGTINAKPARFAWPLTSLTDRFGNKITYEYEQVQTGLPNVGVEIYLKAIRYALVGSPAAATRHIEFTHPAPNPPEASAAREDPQARYVRGFKLMTRRRLTNIKVKHGPAASAATIREYRLSYQISATSARSLLRAVTECAGDGQCRNPVVFSYQQGATSFAEGVVVDAPLFSPTPPSGWDQNGIATVQVADLNNDGRDDLLIRGSASPAEREKWAVHISTGTGFEPRVVTNLPPGKDGAGKYGEGASIDLRGTGEIVTGMYRSPDGTAYEYWQRTGSGWNTFQKVDPYPSGLDGFPGVTGDMRGEGRSTLLGGNGSSWFLVPLDPAVPVNLPTNVDPETDVHPESGRNHYVDIDGDSTEELLTTSRVPSPGSGYEAFNLSRSGSLTRTRLLNLGTLLDRRELFADMNGDGLRDAVLIPTGTPSNPGIAAEPSIQINMGNGFESIPFANQCAGAPFQFKIAPAYSPGSTIAADVGVRIGDMNQNGRDEIILLGNGGLKTIEFDPITRQPTCADLKPDLPTCLFLNNHGNKLCQVLDMNGDGALDVVQGTDTELKAYLNTTAKADLLMSVEEPIGRLDKVFYAPISSDVHSVKLPEQPPPPAPPVTDPLVYPLYRVKRGYDLVSKIQRDSGTFPPQELTYKYENGVLDLQGRGWLGFTAQEVTEHRIATNPNDNVVHRYEYTVVDPTGERYGRVYPKAFHAGTVRTTYPPHAGRQLTRVQSFELRILPTSLTAGQRQTLEQQRFGLVPGDQSDILYDTAAGDTPSEEQAISHREVGRGWANDGALTSHAIRLGPFGAHTPRLNETIWSALDTATRDEPYIIGEVHRESVEHIRPGRTETVERRYTYYSNGGIQTVTTEPGTATAIDPTLNRVQTVVRKSNGVITDITDRGHVTAPWPQGVTNPPAPPGEYAGVIQERKIHIDYDSEDVFPAAIEQRDSSDRSITREMLIYHPGLGVLAGRVSSNGAFTAFQYDGFGRLANVKRPQTGIVQNPPPADVSLEYTTVFGFPLSVIRTDRAAGVSIDSYDRLGRLVLNMSRGSHDRLVRSKLAYKETGELAEVYTPTFGTPTEKTQYEFDAAGRILSVTEPGTPATTYSYDGLVTTITPPPPRPGEATVTTRELRDMGGRVVELQRGTMVTKYGYGPFGELETVTLPGGAGTVTYEHDKLGRRRKFTDRNSGEIVFVPNAFGEVVHQKDKRGYNVTNSYDDLGRLESILSPDGTSVFLHDMVPHGLGKLGAAISPVGVRTDFEYDAADRVFAEKLTIPGLAAPVVVTNLYDTEGRLSGRRFPGIGNQTVQFDFKYSPGNSGDVLQVFNSATPSKPIWRVEDRSPYGTVAQEIFGNELRVTRQQHQTFDLLTNLRAAVVPGALDDDPTTGGPPPVVPDVVNEGTIQALEYQYDDHRNLRYRYDRRLAIQDDFTPDSLDRLSFWRTRSPAGDTTFEYKYDAATNLQERAVSSGTGTGFTLEHGGAAAQAGPHAVSGPGGGYYYDLRGLQTTAPGRSVDYSADELPKTMTVDGIQTTYLYDAFSNRTVKSGSIRQAFYGNGYERRHEDGKVIHVFDIPGDNRVVGQMFLEEQNGVIVTAPEYQYIHDDVLGSTETVTTGAGGVVGDRVRWDPFGRQVQLLDPKQPTTGLPGKIRLGFTGHEQDQESGLVNMRGRIYDPTIGHFLTPDPVVGAPFDGTAFNAYSYVLNNPVTLVDPSGFSPDRPWLSGWCLPFVNCSGPPPRGPSGPAITGTGGGGGPRNRGDQSTVVGSWRQSPVVYGPQVVGSQGPINDFTNPANRRTGTGFDLVAAHQYPSRAVPDLYEGLVQLVVPTSPEEMMLAAAFGPLGKLAGGLAKRAGSVVLYHGTTASSAARILEKGFRAGADNAVYFAEDFATAAHFAREAMAARGALGGTVLKLTVPFDIAARLQRGVLGAARGAPPIDILGGTGQELILRAPQLGPFNSAIMEGAISTTRLRLSF